MISNQIQTVQEIIASLEFFLYVKFFVGIKFYNYTYKGKDIPKNLRKLYDYIERKQMDNQSGE